MRSATLVLVTLLCSTSLMAQGTDANLRSELEALHAKWFKAFDIGDGATMDQMEMDNLVLVMPNGDIWRKPGPRAGKQRKLDPHSERTLAMSSCAASEARPSSLASAVIRSSSQHR